MTVIGHKNMENGAMKQIIAFTPAALMDEFLNSVEIRHYKPNEFLFNQGGQAIGIYAVESGNVKVSRNTHKKTQQIVLLNGKNEMMGISAIFNNHPLLYTARAITPTQIHFLPMAKALSLSKLNPLVLVPLMNKVNETIEELDRHTALVMSNDANTVVLKTMQRLQAKFGTDVHGFINIKLPVTDLANYVCMSKTNLYRVLNNLQERMIISYETNRYKLFNFE